MPTVKSLTMIMIAVNDMPRAKAFYADTLGLNVTTDYRQDDTHWWVALTFPEGGTSLTLSTHHGHLQPGTMQLYVATADVVAAHKELSSKGIEVSDVQDDLFGPGSGVKWCSLKDPDGNQLLLGQM